MMSSNCPVCGSGNVIEQGLYRNKHPLFDSCSRVICGDCEMIFASPMPCESALLEYNTHYFAVAHGGQPTDKLAIAFFAGIARVRHAFVSRFLMQHQITVNGVLELGPGPGYFARSWIQDMPQSSYYAVETDGSCHQALRELGVQIVDLADCPPVDMVVASHVLEHVPDPVGFIRTATRGLRPGGVLFAEIPCRDWEHKAIDEPHVLFFDKVPMRRLLEDLGFTDIELSYHGQKISKLTSELGLHSSLMRVRTKLISWGLIAPFAKKRDGMEMIIDPLQRAMVKPYEAHRESSQPSWWLRALARKS